MRNLHRIPVVAAALTAGLLAIEPASADAPPAGFGHRAAPAYGPRHAPSPRHFGPAPAGRHFGYGGPRAHHYGHRGVVIASGAGPVPPFYDGMGDAAAGLADQPVGLTLYREAYIARGIIYNTPPTLDRPGPGFGGGPVLSARY